MSVGYCFQYPNMAAFGPIPKGSIAAICAGLSP